MGDTERTKVLKKLEKLEPLEKKLDKLDYRIGELVDLVHQQNEIIGLLKNQTVSKRSSRRPSQRCYYPRRRKLLQRVLHASVINHSGPKQKDCPKDSNTSLQLGDALRENANLILDTLDFKETGLSNDLVQDSCLSEQECKTIEEITPRRKQLRTLLTMLMDRDPSVIEKFLKHVSKHHGPEISRSVYQSLRQNQKGCSGSEPKCSFCRLKSIDIMPVLDLLWSSGCIPLVFYRECINSTCTPGGQDELWDNLSHCLAKSPNPQKALGKIVEHLNKYSFHSNLASQLKIEMMGRSRKLRCMCESASNSSMSTTSDKESDMDEGVCHRAAGLQTTSEFHIPVDMSLDHPMDTEGQRKGIRLWVIARTKLHAVYNFTHPRD